VRGNTVSENEVNLPVKESLAGEDITRHFNEHGEVANEETAENVFDDVAHWPKHCSGRVLKELVKRRSFQNKDGTFSPTVKVGQ